MTMPPPARDDWRLVPDAIIDTDKRQQEADKWATQARTSIADDWAGGHLDSLRQDYPDLAAFQSPTSSDTLTNPPRVTPPAARPLPAPDAPAPMDLSRPTALPAPDAPVPTTYQAPPPDALTPPAGEIVPANRGGRQAFADSFRPYAEYAGRILGVDPSIVTAMAISESGGGNIPGNSFFGMKGSPFASGRINLPTWELVNGQRVNINDNFATFATPKDAVDAWIDHLSKHTPGVFGASTPEQFAAGLKAGGYMTDTAEHYASTLRGLGAKPGGGTPNGQIPTPSTNPAPQLSAGLPGDVNAGARPAPAPTGVDFSTAVQQARDAVGGAVQSTGGAIQAAGKSFDDVVTEARNAVGTLGQNVQSPNTGNAALDVLGTGASALGTVAHSAADALGSANQSARNNVPGFAGAADAIGGAVHGFQELTGGGSERFPSGGPLAGPGVGVGRQVAGFEQLAAENPQYRALQRERDSLLSQQPSNAAAAGGSDVIARAQRIRELEQQMRDIARQTDIAATAQRNPNIAGYETAGGLMQGAAAAALAPAGLSSGVGRALASAVVDPASAPFLGAQGLLEGAGALTRAMEPARAPAAALDQLGKMPGGAELAPIREIPQQSGTDLLAAMVDELRARGADPVQIADLERQVKALDPQAAVRRAWSPAQFSQLVATVDSGLSKDLVRGALQGAIVGAVQGAQDPNASAGSIALAGLEGAGLGAARAGLMRNAPEAGRLLGRTAHLLSEEPGPGRVPLDEQGMIDAYNELGTRYEVNLGRIGELEQRLADFAEAGDSIVQRPPWAAGLTDAQVSAIAREQGVSGAAPLWWERVGLTAGSEEVSRALQDLPHINTSGATSRTALERELADLHAAQQAIERDTDLLSNAAESGTQLYSHNVDVAQTAAEDFAPVEASARARMSAPLPERPPAQPEQMGGVPHKHLGGQIDMPYRTRSEFDPAAVARGATTGAEDLSAIPHGTGGQLTMPARTGGPFDASGAVVRTGGETREQIMRDRRLLERARFQREMASLPGPVQNPQREARRIAAAAQAGSTKADYAALRQLRETAVQIPLEGNPNRPVSAVDHAHAVFASNMMSSPHSLVMNAVSDLAELGSRVPRLLLAGYPREALDTAIFAGAAIGDALRDGGRALWTGARPSLERMPGMAEHFDTQPGTFMGRRGLVATPALRINTATDEFTRTLAAAGAEGAEWRRLMRQYGLNANDAMERFRPQILQAGRMAAEDATFSRGGSGLGAWLAKTRTELGNSPSVPKRLVGLFLNLTVPFSKVPDVLLLGGLRRITPLNEIAGLASAAYEVTPAFQETRRALLRRLGVPETSLPPVRADWRQFRLRLADMALMSGINVAVFSQVLQGNITGAGPTDFDKRRQLESARDKDGNPLWQAHSVRLGNRWYDYSGMGYLAIPLAVISTGYERSIAEGKKPDPDVLPAIINGTADVIGDSWYLRGLADLLGGFKDGRFTRVAGQFISTTTDRLVPGSALLNEIRNMQDPTVREPANVLEREQNRIPFLSQNVPPRIERATGEPEQRPRDLVGMLTRSGAPTTPEPNDAVRRELQARGVTIGDAPPDLSLPNRPNVRVDLTDDEQRQYSTIAGHHIADFIGKELGRSSYQKAKPDVQRERLRDLIAEARERAHDQVLRQIGNPEITRRLREQQTRKAS